MKTKNNNPGGRKPATSGLVGGPNTLTDSTMKTRAPNQTIDYLLNEYTDEQSRLGDRYGEEPTQDILTDLLTDLRHYCESLGLDFDLALRRSAFHKLAESAQQLPTVTGPKFPYVARLGG
jgi:hypothetical protein